MLSPNVFSILSLILVLVSIRVLITTVRTRRTLFDREFTAADRQQMSQVAFFILLPLSVIFHEAGHAVLIKAFGGQITGFGYYFFYGFVEHQGFYTWDQIFWIALAGNLVSVVLGLGAIGWVLARPMRPAINYLLLVFAAIDLANSLVFYPLLDLAGGFVGDWSQIYSGHTPTLSTITAIVQGGIILAAIVGWRSDRARRRYAELTGLSPAAMRRVSKAQAANELLAVGEQLSAQWQHPLRVVADAQNGAAGVTLHWISRGYGRVVGAYAITESQSHIELLGGLHALDDTFKPHQQPIGFVPGIPEPAQLTSILTQALDLVESWEATALPMA